MPAAAIPAILGTVVSLAGTGAGIAAASEEASAENNVVSTSLQQLQSLQNQSTPTVKKQIQSSTEPAASSDVQAGQQKALGDYYAAQSAPLTGTSPVGGSSSSTITSAATGAKEQAYTQADANVEGYTNLGQQWQLSDAATRDLLGNRSAQGQSIESALPAQLAYAKNSQATLAAIGSLLSSAGGLGATYGAQAGGFNASPIVAPGQSFGGASTLSYGVPAYNWQSPVLANYQGEVGAAA